MTQSIERFRAKGNRMGQFPRCKLVVDSVVIQLATSPRFDLFQRSMIDLLRNCDPIVSYGNGFRASFERNKTICDRISVMETKKAAFVWPLLLSCSRYSEDHNIAIPGGVEFSPRHAHWEHGYPTEVAWSQCMQPSDLRFRLNRRFVKLNSAFLEAYSLASSVSQEVQLGSSDD